MSTTYAGDGSYAGSHNRIPEEVHDRSRRTGGEIKNSHEEHKNSINTAPPRREDGACFSCGGEIGKDHIEKFPQTNVCGTCYDRLVAQKRRGDQ